MISEFQPSSGKYEVKFCFYTLIVPSYIVPFAKQLICMEIFHHIALYLEVFSRYPDIKDSYLENRFQILH